MDRKLDVSDGDMETLIFFLLHFAINFISLKFFFFFFFNAFNLDK